MYYVLILCIDPSGQEAIFFGNADLSSRWISIRSIFCYKTSGPRHLCVKQHGRPHPQRHEAAISNLLPSATDGFAATEE